MPAPLAIGFCPSCQELLTPYRTGCPGCARNLVPVTITDAPDHVIATVTAIAAGEMICLGMGDPAAHALLLAELLLREARAV